MFVNYMILKLNIQERLLKKLYSYSTSNLCVYRLDFVSVKATETYNLLIISS